MDESSTALLRLGHAGLAFAVWASAWALMAALEDHLDLGSLAMVLVLASTLATLWLPVLPSNLVTAASVLAFDWFFVPPRHAWSVDLRQDALLLVTTLGISWIVAGVMGRQRREAARARRYGERVQQLYQFGQTVRESAEPTHQAGVLQEALAEVLGKRPCLLLLRASLPPADDADATIELGEAAPEERAGLWQCLRQGQPFGPGTGRYEDMPEWYFPMRARLAAFGAAMIRLGDEGPRDDEARAQAQALCDLMGTVLQRAQVQRGADAAREQAHAEQVRNAMLAAISHDYRTPLAAIMGAASSLLDQGERMAAPQRQGLAAGILEETEHLARLTDNTLQLARLGASQGAALSPDWESPEEIVGAVMRRQRSREGHERLRARVEPGLPLVRCDPFLMAQMLENLIDNALKYSDPPAPVELLVRKQENRVLFAVRDRGYGVGPPWRERIFQVFQRGDSQPGAHARRTRSAGVGLAVCRAIARAHGGELVLRPRAHGGSSFECWLPEAVVPAVTAKSE